MAKIPRCLNQHQTGISQKARDQPAPTGVPEHSSPTIDKQVEMLMSMLTRHCKRLTRKQSFSF
jgi:hypothetical protein